MLFAIRTGMFFTVVLRKVDTSVAPRLSWGC